MEKHTPGPLSTCGCRGAVWSSNVVVFCPLHAAAPEMLKVLFEYLTESPYSGWDEVAFIKLAGAVYRKATGG